MSGHLNTSQDWNTIKCPVCTGSDKDQLLKYGKKIFFICAACDLIYVPPVFHLSAESEKKRYDFHNNSESDPGYIRHLNKIFNPVKDRYSDVSKGLDFGSGPEPVLYRLFKRFGYSMEKYDKYYAPDQHVLGLTYDFITLCEVIEHVREPMTVLSKLYKQLAPGGSLFIMTEMTDNISNFKGWRYKNDETHISFFSRKTFEYIAEILKCRVAYPDNGVTIFQKKLKKPL